MNETKEEQEIRNGKYFNNSEGKGKILQQYKGNGEYKIKENEMERNKEER